MKTEEKIEAATSAMVDAREQYESAVNAMGQLELEREKLTGGSDWNTSRMMDLAKQAWPIALKFGSAVAGGGGIAALLADPGAFESLRTSIAGIFGG